ncbi:MAG: hypothetical protein QXE51_00310 [Nitrososphaeria archaeon]
MPEDIVFLHCLGLSPKEVQEISDSVPGDNVVEYIKKMFSGADDFNKKE